METPDKPRGAFALAELRERLEKQIKDAVRNYEATQSGPVELDMSLVEGEGGAESDDTLRKSVEAIVDSFHRNPVVSETGVRVHKVTAIDSDADGQVAVRVAYDYPIG